MQGRMARARAWWRSHPYARAGLLYVVLAAIWVHDWDGYVFETAVRQLWDGRTPYEVAAERPYYAFLNPADTEVQWYAYPPLPLLLMALTFGPVLLLEAAGAAVPEFAERVLLKLPAILGTLALAWVARRWASRLEASPEEAAAIERRFLLNPFLILVGPVWGMTDTLLMALLMGGLLVLAQKRPLVGGALAGLAILVKPFPILLLVPLAPYLVGRDGWRSTVRFAGAAVATCLALSLPFLVADSSAYWHQAVGAHLARPPQGLTIWTLWPLALLPAQAISAASLVLMAVSLLVVGVAASRIAGRGATMTLLLAAAIAVLLWNRVVNEQYLVLVVAPMLILDVVHRLDRFGHALTRWTPALFAAAIALVGFHFLTFLPPDIATPLFFGYPTDFIAYQLRRLMPGFWQTLFLAFQVLVPVTLVALGAFAWRLLRPILRSRSARRGSALPTAVACGALLALALVPVVNPVQARDVHFEPAFDEPKVAAFYYLWWQNAAHDPDVRYGNWPVVSQVPEMGYYTNTRGVARDHARMMVENGIDTAIVSYHRGELVRYEVFQEEAEKAGLWVAPLIELNQVYDQAEHDPIDETGAEVRGATYRLDAGTRHAIADFVRDLAPALAEPSTLRLDGRPVVLFYDSYVSSMGFADEDKRSLADTMLELHGIDALRAAFRDPDMPATVDGVLRHHPTIRAGFYDPGPAALWRQAHLEQHKRFWVELRAELEAEMGPLYLVSGDALNERAGFDAGTVKALVGLEVFDAAFIYSPSFTWGNQPKAPFNDTFALYEDRNHWLTSFARTVGAGSSFGIAPAYDDTVNRPHGFAIPAFPAEHPGRSFYDLSWDSAHAEPPTLAGVATFNEFFEGSSIEPSREYGDRFLKQTAEERARLQRPANTRDVVVVLHERSSRTSLHYSETDLSHFWGLDLLSATPRAIPRAQVAAMDALEPRLAEAQQPALLLVEGGRGQFGASPAVLSRLAAWAPSTPQLVLGSDLAQSLGSALGTTCLPGLDDVPDPKTLVAGDVLSGSGGNLTLQRAGATYHVGTACAPGLRAATSVKPWVATNATLQSWGGAYDALNTRCLAVTMQALLPAFAAADAPTSCTVPPPPPGLARGTETS